MGLRKRIADNSPTTSSRGDLRLTGRFLVGLTVVAVCLMIAFAGCEAPSSAEAASETKANPIVAGTFPMDIPYTLKKPGKVSMAIYDHEGRLLRTLKRAHPEAPGAHTAQWDGLGREGRPAAPGKYTWKLLRTDGLRSELLAQVGINPGPFWEIGVGNHSAASVLAADGDGFFLFPSVAEGGFKAAKIRPDRSYGWGAVNYTFNYLRSGAAPRLKFQHKIRWGYRPVAAAAAGPRVYILSRNGNVYMLDRKTGRKRGKSFSVKWPEDPKMVPVQAMDMDADKKHLVVSYREHDAVRWFDPETGELRKTVKKIKSPLGVAVRPDATALVISEGAVKSVGPGAGQPEIAIPAKLLKSPWRLDISPSTKEIFVAENSLAAGHKAAQHRVKRFSPEGKCLGRFGETQGRQDGPYRPHNFWNISDIVCDETGGFVVAEPNCPPRRVARFSRKGELVMQFFGALPYGTGCTPEPDNPRIVWYGTGSGAVRAEVDFENQSWQVLETYFHTLRQNELVGGFSGTKIYRARGRTYITTFKKSNSLLLYDPKAKRLRPLYTLGHQYLDYKGWVVPERFRDDKPKFRIRTGYIWCDEDADGRAVRQELRLFNAWRAGGPGGRILHVGEDLTLYYANGKRLTPTSITEAGVPLYAPENTETFLNGYFRGLLQDAEGHWYSTRSGKLHGETHGIYWYPGTKGTDRLIKYNSNFNRQWAVGRHNARWDHEPGWSHSLIGVAGVTHGCVVADGNFVDTELVGPMVWTEDGLFVDELCVHPAGNLPEWIYRGSKLENPRGTVVDDPETGEALFYAHGNSAAPIWRIHGWDGWDRQSGEIRM
ncbi:MAG: hypothetical protein KGZ25_01905, partial [Planctomycetes bacterium]|nr:hypothetical protein [Planctomycetota bacterium]